MKAMFFIITFLLFSIFGCIALNPKVPQATQTSEEAKDSTSASLTELVNVAERSCFYYPNGEKMNPYRCRDCIITIAKNSKNKAVCAMIVKCELDDYIYHDEINYCEGQVG
jgi:hypothetical protein